MTNSLYLVPTTKRDARKRYNAGEVIGVAQDHYPYGLTGQGVTRDHLGWTFDELAERSIDGRRPSCVFWFRPVQPAANAQTSTAS